MSPDEHYKPTFAACVELAADGLPIDGVVVGTRNPYQWPPKPASEPESWASARRALDYAWDAGYGGTACHSIYAWTAERVVFTHAYDGSTCVMWVPRNPTICAPQYNGEEAA